MRVIQTALAEGLARGALESCNSQRSRQELVDPVGHQQRKVPVGAAIKSDRSNNQTAKSKAHGH